MVLARKLKDILKDLEPLAQRGKITRFLKNTEDVAKLSGMVEDIRNAMIEYQVCAYRPCPHPHLMSVSDVVAARSLPKELSAYCTSY